MVLAIWHTWFGYSAARSITASLSIEHIACSVQYMFGLVHASSVAPLWAYTGEHVLSETAEVLQEVSHDRSR